MTKRGRPPRPYLDPHLSERAEGGNDVHCTFGAHQRVVNLACRYVLMLAAYRLDGRSQCRALALRATATAYGLSPDRVEDILRREKKTLPPDWRALIPSLREATAMVRQHESTGNRLPR